MKAIAPYAKAVTAAIVAGLTAALAGVTEGGFGWDDAIITAIAFFGALGAVWAVPNKLPIPSKKA